MRRFSTLAVALLAIAAPACPALASVCQAGKMMCATTMPVGGYCECTVHGHVQDGTVIAKRPTHHSMNATAGGCGSQPNAPGCH